MSDNAKMVFAENLKAYLNSKGYTQLDLATYMNCSSSTVSDWCNGKKYPRVDKMQRMADWLGIQMSDLTSEHDKLDDADIAFYNRYKQLTEEEKEDMRDFLRQNFIAIVGFMMWMSYHLIGFRQLLRQCDIMEHMRLGLIFPVCILCARCAPPCCMNRATCVPAHCIRWTARSSWWSRTNTAPMRTRSAAACRRKKSARQCGQATQNPGSWQNILTWTKTT